MPSKRQHLKQAAHNEELLTRFNLVGLGFEDWAVTALFYSALHYVEAFFHEKFNRHYTNHPDRDDAVARCLPHCYDEYHELKNDSREVRYAMRKFTPKEVEDDIIPNFEKVRTTVTQQLD